MKYVVYVTSYITSEISGGNLIGEGRWERNVLDALVKDGRDVYAVPWCNSGPYVPGEVRVWRSPLPKPPNLKDYGELTDLTDTLFISHSPTGSLDIPVEAHRYAIQWFNGPDGDVGGKFKTFIDQRPGSVVATYNFPLRAEQYVKSFGLQNTACIAGPAVDQIYPDVDNFKAEYLMWTSKVLWAWSQTPHMIPQLTKIFAWVTKALKEDPTLKLGFLLGTVGGFKTHQQVVDWFWTCSFAQQLIEVESQVEFQLSVEWNKVDEIFRKTRLVVAPWLGFGGPPYELAAFGVPLILCKNGHPFQDIRNVPLFSEVLTVANEQDEKFIEHLDKLFRDHDHYRKTGSAYRNFVANNGCYRAYLNQLDQLCRNKGWM